MTTQIIPEIITILTIVLLIVIEIISFKKDNFIIPFTLSIISVFISLLTSIYNLKNIANINHCFLEGRFCLNGEGVMFKILFLFIVLFILCMSFDDFNNIINTKQDTRYGEFCMLLLTTLVGALFLVSSSDMVTFYVSLEMTIIPIYLLISWKENSWSAESSIKYLLVGMFSSVFLLLALSYLYGLTGSTDFYTIYYRLFNNITVYFIAILLLINICFKMGIVPFHMWISDVYYGSSITITAYLSVFSKVVGIALIWIIFYRILGNHIVHKSTMFIAIMSSISMTLGNVLAITQNNIKRIMAFSSISQAGYILMGFIKGGTLGMAAVFYYTLIYVVTNLSVFFVIMFYKKKFNVENILDYKNLSEKSPIMSVFFLIALFSLAGIPPLSGFIGKFFLFSIAAEEGLNWLVLVAALNSTVSLYYYLGIIKKIYIDRSDNTYVFENNSSLVILQSGAFILSMGIMLLGCPIFYNTIYTTLTHC